jgi:hypothetical protein
VNSSGVNRFIDAILADRPPNMFTVTSDDLDVLRVALELRAGRGELGQAERQFVEGLHQHLAASGDAGGLLVPLPHDIGHRSGGSEAGVARPRSVPTGCVGRHLGPAAMAAAAVVLVAGAWGATKVAGAYLHGSRGGRPPLLPCTPPS